MYFVVRLANKNYKHQSNTVNKLKECYEGPNRDIELKKVSGTSTVISISQL